MRDASTHLFPKFGLSIYCKDLIIGFFSEGIRGMQCQPPVNWTVSKDDLKKTLDASRITVRMHTYVLSNAWGSFCANLGLLHQETIENGFWLTVIPVPNRNKFGIK